MESLLAQQVSAWQASQTIGGPHEDTLEQQLATQQTELIALQAHYTPDHPDVIKLKQDIAALKKKIDENAAPAKEKTASPPAPAVESPEIQRLRFQIHQTETLISQKTHEQARLKQQLNTYQARVSMSPMVEQRFKELTRDYQTALQFYNDLLSKRSQSEMATSLERRQQGEQFRVMDPADLPEKPSFPNRPAFAGGGLGIGLALGIAITLLLELRDKTLRTENDIEHFLRLPILALVPLIDRGSENRQRVAAPGDGDESKRSAIAHRA